MKSAAVIVALGLSTSAYAQSACAPLAAKIPSCATECIASAASGVGCSGPTDFACQCKNTEKINAAALNCVLKGCGPQTGLAVQASASAVCDCVATAAPGDDATSGAPSSPAATSAAQSASEPAATSSAAAGSSSAAAAAGGSSSAAPYPTSKPAVSQITDGQVQATGGASPSGNSTVVPFTGAGVKVAASVGSLLLAFGAAVVAL